MPAEMTLNGGRLVRAHVVLDWRDPKHFGTRRLPCRVCRSLTWLRDDRGRPCDKTCAEAELAAELMHGQPDGFTDERHETPAAGGAESARDVVPGLAHHRHRAPGPVTDGGARL